MELRWLGFQKRSRHPASSYGYPSSELAPQHKIAVHKPLEDAFFNVLWTHVQDVDSNLIHSIKITSGTQHFYSCPLPLHQVKSLS